MPLLVVLAAGPAPMRLAAPEWATVNMPADLGSFYAEEFARALRAQGFEVITARDMQTLLGLERQKQLLGCSESSCIAELGAALGCERVLQGQLARLDDTYRGSLKIISSTSGLALVEEAVEASGQKALVSALEDAARRMARKLNPAAKPAESPSRGPNLLWVPVIAGGVALGVGSSVCFATAGAKADAIAQQSVEGEAFKLAQDGKGFEAAGWVLAGTGTAALVTGVVLAVTGSAPKVTPSVSMSSTGASVGVGGVFP